MYWFCRMGLQLECLFKGASKAAEVSRVKGDGNMEAQSQDPQRRPGTRQRSLSCNQQLAAKFRRYGDVVDSARRRQWLMNGCLSQVAQLN